MQPITASLMWLYLARNRWLLPVPFLLSLAIAMLLLVPLRSLDFSPDSRELIGLQLALLLALDLIVIAGAFESQGSLRPLYTKPISTAGMVGFFFWGGALLVAAPIGALFALCRLLLGADWPIASPALFAAVAWGWTQLLFRATMRTGWWIPTALLVYSALVYWSMSRHGVAFKAGGMLAPSVHHWSTINGTDLAIAVISLIAIYGLTVWRVSCDRSGRPLRLFGRGDRIWTTAKTRERAPKPIAFRSGPAAFEWFDFQNRQALLPSAVLAELLLVWLTAIAFCLLLGDSSVILPISRSGTLLALVVQFVAATFLPIGAMKGHSAQDNQPSGRNPEGSKPTPFGMSQFIKALPLPTRQIASAMLRSSARAVAISAAYIFASFVLIGILDSILGQTPRDPSDVRLHVRPLPLALAFAISIGSMLLSFVALNLTCLYAPRKVSWEHWVAPAAIALNMLTIWNPGFQLVSWGVAGVALAGLVHATGKSLKSGDLPVSWTVLLWLAGAALTECLGYCLPSDSRLPSGVLCGTLVLLALLSTFSTASALRLLRTN